jgi:hypothetical protein
LLSSWLVRSLLLAVPSALIVGATAHCGAEGEEPGFPITSSETGGDSGADTLPDDGPVPDGTPGPTPVTCTKAPSFGTAIRVNRNPDALRKIANAGIVLMPDGRLMVGMLEALDASRFGVFVRFVDPATGKVDPDQRLDVDADNLVEGSAFALFSAPGGAVVAMYGGKHLRVFRDGKWSPDAASVLPTLFGQQGLLASPTGEVLLTRITAEAPFLQASVWRPDQGGPLGTWSPAQTLDVDGATAAPTRVDRITLTDGRFLTLNWQGPGGPSIRVRSPSGSWSTAYAKPELGALVEDDNRNLPAQYHRLVNDTIVMVATEATPAIGGAASRTFRALTATWSERDGWSTGRLLSRPTKDTAGVVPWVGNRQWFLYRVGPDELEYVAFVASCVSAEAECTFNPIQRRYKDGEWTDPVALDVGTAAVGGGGLAVWNLQGSPLVTRAVGNRIDIKARFATEWSKTVTTTKDSPLFPEGTTVAPWYYGGPAGGLWTLVQRAQGAPPALVGAAVGRIDLNAGSVTWSTIAAGSYELRAIGGSSGYADGAGGFTVGTGAATDGTNAAPIIAHLNEKATTPEAVALISADETAAQFVGVPAQPPSVRTRSAIYAVAGTPSDPATAGKSRLRAYAWNGIGGGVPKLLANESRAPRYFGLQNFGCGGAILYAVDPLDGSHALELVLVKETGS